MTFFVGSAPVAGAQPTKNEGSGPEVELPADASAKDMLLAFYGRRP